MGEYPYDTVWVFPHIIWYENVQANAKGFTEFFHGERVDDVWIFNKIVIPDRVRFVSRAQHPTLILILNISSHPFSANDYSNNGLHIF